MHSRMRARVTEFLKVLNRAKMENREVERKTVRSVVSFSCDIPAKAQEQRANVGAAVNYALSIKYLFTCHIESIRM